MSSQLAFLPFLTIVSLSCEEMVVESDNETCKTSSKLSSNSSGASLSYSGTSNKQLQTQTKSVNYQIILMV